MGEEDQGHSTNPKRGIDGNGPIGEVDEGLSGGWDVPIGWGVQAVGRRDR